MKSTRIHFVMPCVWPVTTKEPSTRAALDIMASHSQFVEMTFALYSDLTWLTEDLLQAYSKALDAAPKDFSREFYASCICAKQVLHYCYDRITGALLKQRVADGMAHGQCLSLYGVPATYEGDWIQYAGSRWRDDEMSVTVWQALDSLSGNEAAWAHQEWSSTVKAMESVGPSEEADANAQAAKSKSFYDLDIFSSLLRTAVCMCACTMRMHLGILHDAHSAPEDFLGFHRTPVGQPAMVQHLNGGKKSKKGFVREKPTQTAWRNYLFDIAVLWTLVLRFRNAILDNDPNAMMHACFKARMWAIATGLAASADALKPVERHLKNRLDRVSQTACAIQWIFSQLHTYALSILHTSVWGSKLGVQRAIFRIGAAVFASVYEDSKDILPDVPEVGTATLADNLWCYSWIRPIHLGLQSPEGHLAIGCEVADLSVSAYMGLLAPNIVKSDGHLWASVSSWKVWVGHMDQGLPSQQQVEEKLFPFLDSCPWFPTLTDFEDGLQAFKDNHTLRETERLSSLNA